MIKISRSITKIIMINLLGGLGLLALSMQARPAVLPIVPSTSTVSEVSVSAASPTSLNLSTSTANAFSVYVEVQNQDATNPIFCSNSSNVAVSGAQSGFEIIAGADEVFTLPQSEQFYCIAKTAAVSAVIIRCQ